MAYTGSKAQAGRGTKIEIGPTSDVSSTPVTFTGSTTSASTSVTSVSPTTGIVNGMGITGTGIPTGTTIVSGGGTATLTLSQAATATASGVSLTATPTFTAIGEIKKAGTGNATFDLENVSNFDSLIDKEFKKMMRDNGKPVFGGFRVSSEAGYIAGRAAFNDADNAYQFRITFPKRKDQVTSGDTLTFNALVMRFNVGDIETDKTIPWEMELQITGPVTETVGS